MSDAPERIYASRDRAGGSYGVWDCDPSNEYGEKIEYVRADTVQAQIDAVTLRQTLHDLITKQSEGEWDDKTIAKDVEVFLTAILAMLRKGDQP